MNRPTIWLLSAYRSTSHGAWAHWLVNSCTQYNWEVLELSGRHFRWRIRGNPLSWLHRLPDTPADLIIATSMVDLATLKGLHPQLSTVPCLYYFHENQFAYPTSKQQHASIDPQMVQLYGALCANQCLFNSAYNRHSFLQGIDQLLSKLPDEVPANIRSCIEEKSKLLSVPIKPIISTLKKQSHLILWNHRWEYDKAPQVFADALSKLNKINPDFKLALLGERATKKNPALLQIENEFADKITINDRASKQDYIKTLCHASIVVSSAIHEFQGLALLEAVSAGAVPVVPDDLCYREQYGEMFRYTANNSDAMAKKLNVFLTNRPDSPDVSNFYDIHLKDKWIEMIERWLLS